MGNITKALQTGLLAATLAAIAMPAMAQDDRGPGGYEHRDDQRDDGQRDEHHHHHHGDIGAGVAAGVLGGLAAGAIAGQGRGYGYAPPPPPNEECRTVRRPVYDEDGEIVSYKLRRICD